MILNPFFSYMEGVQLVLFRSEPMVCS